MTTTTIRRPPPNVNADPRALRLAPITEADAVNEAEPLAFDGPEPTFTRGPARRPVEPTSGPLLQWATGLPTSDRRIYAGWFVESGKDEALDEAMADAGFGFVQIKHGGGNLATHWAVETANLFFVTEGVMTSAEMRRNGQRFGIAFGWRTLEGGRQQSWLQARVFIRELLAVDYQEPLTLTIKGTITDDLIAALVRQYDVLNYADASAREKGKPAPELPYYAFDIPLGPGASVKRGTGSAVKEIMPMAALVPATLDGNYLKAHYTKHAWNQAIEAHLDEAVQWSVTISAGEEGGEG